MSPIAVLTAAGGASWESSLLRELGDPANAHGVHIVRRCVDVVDLLAVAGAGHAQAALVSASLRRFDADAIERLTAGGIALVAVLDGGVADGQQDAASPAQVASAEESGRLRGMGLRHIVSADARVEVVAAALAAACADAAKRAGDPAAGFGLSTAAVEAPGPPGSFEGSLLDGGPRLDGFQSGGFQSGGSQSGGSQSGGSQSGSFQSGGSRPGSAQPSAPGALIAVWGPTGGPGRSTVAATLADEIARFGRTALLADADVYGGSIATMLGLLDESPGIAAATRQAANGRLDREALAALCWAAEPRLRVLTGLPRADRWPELRPPAVERLLGTCRSMADFTVVDTGFCLETDEELSFDTAAPRRNGATLAVLDEADVVIAVGSADPMGVARLVRALEDLREARVGAPVWIVLNRVRDSATNGPARSELAEAIVRFGGQPPAAYLPLDHAALDSAVLAGAPVARVAPHSPFRAAVVELAAALCGEPSEHAPSRRSARESRARAGRQGAAADGRRRRRAR